LSFTDWQHAMRQGDFEQAWRISDAVLAGRDMRFCDDPSLPYHQRFVWDGTDPTGRHVLVRCYHGLGDTLQFARFLPTLANIAASVTLEAQPELCPLLEKKSPLPLAGEEAAQPARAGKVRDRAVQKPSAAKHGAITIIPFNLAHPHPPAECNLEIMELAHALRARDVSANHDYLAPPAPRVEGGRRIGLCWAAGDWDQARSIPPALLFNALHGQDIELYSLQRGKYADALDPALRKRLRNPADRSMHVTDTAALIATLDIVVTVDSFVAHLAGALGKPACILLKHDADWRWMQGERTAWYPRAKLMRQRKDGDWDGPLVEVKNVLF
jgi:hypothetical protein